MGHKGYTKVDLTGRHLSGTAQTQRERVEGLVRATHRHVRGPGPCRLCPPTLVDYVESESDHYRGKNWGDVPGLATSVDNPRLDFVRLPSHEAYSIDRDY